MPRRPSDLVVSNSIPLLLMDTHITDACINNGDLFLTTDGEENRGYRNLPRYSKFACKLYCDWYIIPRIGGSVLDVKKWIESGTPVDVMSTLSSLIGSNTPATNMQKLFAGMKDTQNEFMLFIEIISYMQQVNCSMQRCSGRKDRLLLLLPRMSVKMSHCSIYWTAS